MRMGGERKGCEVTVDALGSGCTGRRLFVATFLFAWIRWWAARALDPDNFLLHWVHSFIRESPGVDAAPPASADPCPPGSPGLDDADAACGRGTVTGTWSLEWRKPETGGQTGVKPGQRTCATESGTTVYTVGMIWNPRRDTCDDASPILRNGRSAVQGAGVWCPVHSVTTPQHRYARSTAGGR